MYFIFIILFFLFFVKKNLTSLKKSCGRATMIPAPSPVFFSQPQAPRCAILSSISIASLTWDKKGNKIDVPYVNSLLQNTYLLDDETHSLAFVIARELSDKPNAARVTLERGVVETNAAVRELRERPDDLGV